ncbi:MAG: COX15/CtaA family protein, partial [Proteobacteria bacterium]|nr:COX15/CtaA family protein [Pseudomonadota bacterium]
MKSGSVRAENAAPRSVALWLFLCAGMVLVMMIIGAITRLTESGLSMVEWRPLIGALPPMNDAEWGRVFALYRETSEYRLANAGMALAEFKAIFWWEFIHRLWGRSIGLVFALPFVVFLIRGMIPRRLIPHLVALFLLGVL